MESLHSSSRTAFVAKEYVGCLKGVHLRYLTSQLLRWKRDKTKECALHRRERRRKRERRSRRQNGAVLTRERRGEGKKEVREESQKLGSLERPLYSALPPALDLLRLACLHESDSATLRLTSVAIHPSELFEIECACLESALKPEPPGEHSSEKVPEIHQ